LIPSPNLDDRTYKEIVDEAIALIPRYCPAWTNHNASDPGMALVELFAWMTEMTIYRLNKVPEKTYLALLDLIGLSLVPPQAAKVLLTFSPVDGYEKPVQVRKALQVSAGADGEGESVVFETEKELVVAALRLAACASLVNGRYSEHLASLSGEVPGFKLFEGTDEIERSLYIEAGCFALLQDANIVCLSFETSRPIASIMEEIVNYLDWYYWDGKKWTPIEAQRSAGGEHKADNVIFFEGPVPLVEAEVEGRTGFVLKASLREMPGSARAFEVDRILVKLLFAGDGLGTDMCYCNTDNMVFHEIDVNKDFCAFVDVPKSNDAFYFSCDDILSKEDARITVSITLSESGETPSPREDFLLEYEFWNGREWALLGSSKAGKKATPKGKYKFWDSTEAMTVTGEVRFDRPPAMRSCSINGQEKIWIRARIAAGDFGSGGQYKQSESGEWKWSFDNPVRSPLLSRVRLRYDAKMRPVERVLSYSDFAYGDLSSSFRANEESVAKDEPTSFVPLFRLKPEARPMTYFGFEGAFPDTEVPIFFKLDESKRVRPSTAPAFGERMIASLPRARRQISLGWEYWNGSAWASLDVNDSTDSFHQSGMVEFRPPKNMRRKSEFGKNLAWVRLVFESGSFERPPLVRGIVLNSVYGWNRRTYFRETLASSGGGPGQSFKLPRSPVLPGLRLIVREFGDPPAPEIEAIESEEGEGAVQRRVDEVSGEEELWVRWHQVDNFHTSSPSSRHYTLDYQNGIVLFGDGRRGMIPPRGKNNVVVESCCVGGGSAGNVAAGTVRVIRDNIPFIAGVVNHYPAEGGSDLEDMESLKQRAAGVFKSLNRAVTADDFEYLAREASASVARAKCLSKAGPNGEIIVVIVPGADFAEYEGDDQLVPTPELIRRVKEYLDARRLIGTSLRVERPVYRSVAIKMRVAIKRGYTDVQKIKEAIVASVRGYLHPLWGGEGSGWPFGTSLSDASLMTQVESVEGVHHVEEVVLTDSGLGKDVERINLREDELISVASVMVDERRYEL